MARSRLMAGLRSLLLLTFAGLLLASAPAAAAPPAQVGPPYPDAEWAGWGLAASFDSGAPIIKFAGYVGKNGTPPVVLGSIVETITEDCEALDANGLPTTLTISADGYANFNGDVYLRCETPSWEAMIDQLAPHLKPAKGTSCECSPTRSPFWGAAEFILQPVAAGSSRANPLLDASELGLTFSLPTNGSVAQSQMMRSSGAYTSGTWLYDSTTGNRVLTGQNGPIDVAIMDYFDGVTFLSGAGWRPYFINTIRGNRFGQWLEPANAGSYANLPNLNYTLSTQESVVYIGRHNGTGALLNGRLRVLQVDPGCYGG